MEFFNNFKYVDTYCQNSTFTSYKNEDDFDKNCSIRTEMKNIIENRPINKEVILSQLMEHLSRSDDFKILLDTYASFSHGDYRSFQELEEGEKLEFMIILYTYTLQRIDTFANIFQKAQEEISYSNDKIKRLNIKLENCESLRKISEEEFENMKNSVNFLIKEKKMIEEEKQKLNDYFQTLLTGIQNEKNGLIHKLELDLEHIRKSSRQTIEENKTKFNEQIESFKKTSFQSIKLLQDEKLDLIEKNIQLTKENQLLQNKLNLKAKTENTKINLKNQFSDIKKYQTEVKEDDSIFRKNYNQSPNTNIGEEEHLSVSELGIDPVEEIPGNNNLFFPEEIRRSLVTDLNMEKSNEHSGELEDIFHNSNNEQYKDDEEEENLHYPLNKLLSFNENNFEKRNSIKKSIFRLKLNQLNNELDENRNIGNCNRAENYITSYSISKSTNFDIDTINFSINPEKKKINKNYQNEKENIDLENCVRNREEIRSEKLKIVNKAENEIYALDEEIISKENLFVEKDKPIRESVVQQVAINMKINIKQKKHNFGYNNFVKLLQEKKANYETSHNYTSNNFVMEELKEHLKNEENGEKFNRTTKLNEENSSFSSNYTEETSPGIKPKKFSEVNNQYVSEFDLTREEMKNTSKTKIFEIKLQQLDTEETVEFKLNEKNTDIIKNKLPDRNEEAGRTMFFKPKNNLISNNQNYSKVNRASKDKASKDNFSPYQDSNNDNHLSRTNSQVSNNSFVEEYIPCKNSNMKNDSSDNSFSKKEYDDDVHNFSVCHIDDCNSNNIFKFNILDDNLNEEEYNLGNNYIIKFDHD